MSCRAGPRARAPGRLLAWPSQIDDWRDAERVHGLVVLGRSEPAPQLLLGIVQHPVLHPLAVVHDDALVVCQEDRDVAALVVRDLRAGDAPRVDLALVV